MPQFVVVLDNVQTPVAAQRFTRIVEAENAKRAPEVAFEKLDEELPLIDSSYTTTLVESVN
ncbi:MAG: hypothetical protein G01um101420_539 [Parcubacteria group bacterium Gr01-1014_20]|nr:MAG: hypothetical protein G01um101420_539 [Parcubacteria group bacterium Gr01-1014_20]